MLNTTIQLRLYKELVDKIDQLRVKLPWRPGRSQTLRWMIEGNMKMLEKEAEQDAGTEPRRSTL